ncbi:hypothetical protein [Bacillus cereus]|nr:hypothetical protein [Bacillus cereus]
MDPGVYVLEYFLVLEAASASAASANVFSFSINGVQNIRSMTNTVGGLLTLSLVVPLNAGSTIQVINNSNTPKTIINPVGNGTTRQSARLNAYRIQQ